MKPTTPLTAQARDERESQEAARARYLKLVQSLGPAQGSYCAADMDITLRHCQAMTEEYQQIMRMMVRPIRSTAPE